MNCEKFIEECEKKLVDVYKKIDETALINQEKVLKAFQKNQVGLRHFAGTTGYGSDDIGKNKLCDLYSDIFHTEAAIVSPLIATGTHAISTALFGLLRPNDILYSITGNPYDTLVDVLTGDNIGSLKEYGVTFDKTDTTENGCFDFEAINKYLHKHNPKIVYMQRSRGYSSRNAFTIAQIKEAIDFVKSINNTAIIFIDNCYGEFIDTIEPTDVGADVIAGSLIKNPGGGIAPTGGYIAGKTNLIELISYRLTCPGIGTEVGSYNSTYQYFYQGVFLAPHVVAQAVKAAQLFCCAFQSLGYDVVPTPGFEYGDIIASIKFKTEEKLIEFCRIIQNCSPIDSYLTPEPCEMPGYEHKVIMAAGAFVQGSSIELSADAPIKPPYIAYFQGSLTYEHAKLALKSCLEKLA